MRGARADLVAWGVLAACVAIHAAIFLPIVSGRDGRFGGDYALHFPNLLAGHFHYLANGPLSVPWFSPAQCGGIPFLADLNVAYYSLPQWLTFFVGPVAAVQVTFVVFAGLGAAGFYLLARNRFDLSPAASLTAAVLFLFNGFFAYRMAIGHLTFHPFMLTPWLAWLALPPAAAGTGGLAWPRLVLMVLLGAAILAYQFHAGMVHAIIPGALAVGAIVLVHGHLHRHAWRPWAILLAAAVLSVALSAQRLSAALAFLDAFPRTLYRLPGFANPLDAARIALEALFWRAPADAMDLLTNRQWDLDPHEWEYGIGPAAAALLLAGAVAVASGLFRRRVPRERVLRGALVALIVTAVLVLPLAVNVYTPGWNALLKEIPVFGSSVSLVRWFVLFIPLAALATGLAFDRVFPAGRARLAGVVAVVATTVAWNVLADKSAYQPLYPGAAIVDMWRHVRSPDEIPPISAIAIAMTDTGEFVYPLERNNTMTFGASQLGCYQPMFGYRLEAFPTKGLRPGTILDRTETGDFNFKNPACYLFPEENDCEPGDHFRIDQVEEAVLFAQYLDFPFRRSRVQIVADTVNLFAFLLSVAAIVVASIAAWRGRKGSTDVRRGASD